ncbi:MAG: alpha/beta fold hydrolase [Pseudomonadota bacterium]|nr:alpha/beta fold hydrolase [Pseudomonadota bacterium]
MRCSTPPPLILGLLLLVAPAVDAGPDLEPKTVARECVILLHGLGRTSRSLNKLADALENAGFSTVNLDYPSRKKAIEELALDTVQRGLDRCARLQVGTVHFVTHSMGGILVRYFLSRQRPKNLGRVVMLSPPNRGSEAADHLQDSALYQWFNGPAGQQLVTGPDGLPAQLGPATFPLGIITGNQHSFFDAWLAEIIPGADDGKVAVERARVEGMTDFLVLPYSHPFIMDADEVIEQTLSFLRVGRFRARPPSADQSPD